MPQRENRLRLRAQTEKELNIFFIFYISFIVKKSSSSTHGFLVFGFPHIYKTFTQKLKPLLLKKKKKTERNISEILETRKKMINYNVR